MWPHTQEHIELGEALAPLRDEGVTIIGSGLSYHNMRGFVIRGRDSATSAIAASQVHGLGGMKFGLECILLVLVALL